MIDQAKIAQAVSLLRAGGLVAFPTETVYGLGADATNAAAIAKIFQAKKRPADHPLIVHIADMNQLEHWAQAISPAARRLAEVFWPGPLTMIFKKQPQVLSIITADQETVGIRMPAHDIAEALLKAFGGALVAPSANQFTHISPTTAAAVQEELGAAVDLILDGGQCDVGLESTIIDMSQETPTILRPGMITAEAISEVLQVEVNTRAQPSSEVRVPGMHHLHYAPQTKTVLIATADLEAYLEQKVTSAKPRVTNSNVVTLGCAKSTKDEMPIAILRCGQGVASATLKFGDSDEGTLGFAQATYQIIHLVIMPSDPVQYAHDLYRELRTLDHGGYKSILIESVPETENWAAIRDRLTKATGGTIISSLI